MAEGGKPGMKNPIGNSGMALLLAVGVISVLSALVIRFGTATEAAMTRAFRFQDDTLLQAMAESGVAIGCRLLFADKAEGDSDSLLDTWARADTVDFGELFAEGSLRVSIEDLSGLLPLNRLAARGDADPEGAGALQFREVLVRLLLGGEFGDIDEDRARTVADSLGDWLDGDDKPLPYGAENAYYLSREHPVLARNGPVEFVDELLAVKGVDAELLYGNNEQRGLAEYISIYGNGRININTAPVAIIVALAGSVPEEAARELDEARRDRGSTTMLDNPDWYRSLSGWPQGVVIDPGLIATRSSVFRVSADAVKDARSVGMQAEVRRDDEEIVVYQRRYSR